MEIIDNIEKQHLEGKYSDLNNYIELMYTKGITDEKTINLIKTFSNINDDYLFDIITNASTNKNMSFSIAIIVNKYINNNSIEIKKIINDFDISPKAKNVFSILIESYCDKKNIQIKEYEINENDFYSEDSLKTYITEIKRFPLLTQEETIELCKLKDAGNYEAKYKLVNSNLRLVLQVAYKYSSAERELLDIIQQGNIGLIKGIERYDYTKGYAISTYVRHWIKQSIHEYFYTNYNSVRIPRKKIVDLKKYNKQRNELIIELGREPSLNEIIQKTNFDEENITIFENLNKKIKSLDENIGEEEDTPLVEMLPDESGSFEEKIIEKDMSSRLYNLVINNKKLTDVEKYIVVNRIGFNGEIKSLKTIGNELGCTNSNVERIEKKCYRKLKPDVIKFYSDLKSKE